MVLGVIGMAESVVLDKLVQAANEAPRRERTSSEHVTQRQDNRRVIFAGLTCLAQIMITWPQIQHTQTAINHLMGATMHIFIAASAPFSHSKGTVLQAARRALLQQPLARSAIDLMR